MCPFETLSLSSGEVDEEKEREHSSMQEQLDKELHELDKRLQQKEVLFSILLVVLHVYILNLQVHYIVF